MTVDGGFFGAGTQVRARVTSCAWTRTTRDGIEAEIETGGFDGYRANGTVWRAGDEQT